MAAKETESDISKIRGTLIAKFGYNLAFQVRDKGYDVLFDHSASSDEDQRVISCFNDEEKCGPRIFDYYYDESEPYGQLGYIDAAIVKKDSNKVFALFKLIFVHGRREVLNRPKTIISNVLGLLLGEKLTFEGRELEIGEWTTLFVITISIIKRKKLNQYIQEKVEQIKPSLGTNNSKIKNIIIETVESTMELFIWLEPVLEKALAEDLKFNGEL
jgi:hypothetical protein